MRLSRLSNERDHFLGVANTSKDEWFSPRRRAHDITIMKERLDEEELVDADLLKLAEWYLLHVRGEARKAENRPAVGDEIRLRVPAIAVREGPPDEQYRRDRANQD